MARQARLGNFTRVTAAFFAATVAVVALLFTGVSPAFAAYTWGPAARVYDQEVVGSSLAVDGNTVIAAWASWTNTGGVIETSTKTGAGSWTQPVTVEALGLDEYKPNIAVDASGRVSLIWMRYDIPHATTVIVSSSRTRHGSWSNPVTLSDPADTVSDNPQIVSDAEGNVTAAWGESVAGTADVMWSSHAAGEAWRPAQSGYGQSNAINDFELAGGSQTGYQNLIVDQQTTQPSTYLELSFRAIVENTVNGPITHIVPELRQLLDTGCNSIAGTHTVVVGTSFYMVYECFHDTGSSIHFRQRDEGGSWGHIVEVSGTHISTSNPVFAVNAAGDVEVAWTQLDGSARVMGTAHRTGAGMWSAPQTIGATDARGFPQIVARPDNSFVLTWDTIPAPNCTVKVALMSASGTVTSVTSLSQPSSSSFLPEIAAAANGDVTITWQSSTLDSRTLSAQAESQLSNTGQNSSTLALIATLATVLVSLGLGLSLLRSLKKAP